MVCRSYEKVVDHIDSESANGEVGQGFGDPTFNWDKAEYGKDGDCHQHDVGGAVGPEEFGLFRCGIGLCCHVAESEVCYGQSAEK